KRRPFTRGQQDLPDVYPARRGQDSRPHGRLDAKQDRPGIATQRMSEVIDPGWIQVGKSVPIHVHTNLDHSDELHEVCDSLPEAVGEEEDRSRRGRGQTLVGRNNAVAVLVEARPPAATVTRAPTVWLTTSVPSGPKPCPT